MLRWIIAAVALASAGLTTAEPAGPGEASVDRILASRVDATLGGAVREGRTSAAMAVYVRDGAIRFARGYGWEDEGRRTPVRVDTTRFQIASITKTFTALALAQLVEAGRIRSFDDHADQYLRDVKLPNWRGHAITLGQLATHSAGFDESWWASLTDHPVGLSARPGDLSSQIPPLYRPPGSLSAYSNLGVDLLGHIVEQVSGRSYDDYVSRQVFAPLGMTATSFVNRSAAHLAIPFDPLRSGSSISYYVRPTSIPSGGAIATAQDMGRYMIALLGGSSIVTPAVRRDLFTLRQQNHPQGAAHGLVWEIWRLGPNTLYVHGGSIGHTECLLALSFQRRSGISWCFTGFKAPRNDTRRLTILGTAPAFLTPILSGSDVAPAPRAAARETLAWKPEWSRYLGTYLSLRRFHFGPGRLGSFLEPSALVIERGPRGLVTKDMGELREIAPGVFQGTDMIDRIAFFTDPFTRRMTASRSIYPTAWQKPELWDDPFIVLPLAALLGALCITGIAFPAWRVGAARVRSAAAVTAALIVAALTALVTGTDLTGDPYGFGDDPPMWAARGLAFVMIAAAGLLTFGLRSRSPRGANIRHTLARVHYGLLVVAAWALLVLVADAGLLAFGIH